MSESSFCLSLLCNFLINGLIDCVHCQSKEEITSSKEYKCQERYQTLQLANLKQYFNLARCFTVSLKDGSKTIHSPNINPLAFAESIQHSSYDLYLRSVTSAQVFLEVRTARCGLKVPQGDCSAMTGFSETHLLLTEDN